MVFVPFVVDSDNTHVTVDIHRMQMSEAEQTNHVPPWQTSWTSDYLMDDRFEKYAVVRGEELIALGAYEVQKASLIVHIVYLESQPASNPTIDKRLEGYAMSDRLNSMSDAEWYCRRDPEEERFYSIFFDFCNKYHVRWASASEKERAFIEEITRVTYERDYATRNGLPLSNVRASFAS